MTKKQMLIIEKHLDIVDSAYKSSTVRGATIEAKKELMNLYVELGYRPTSIACPSCVIGFLSTLGSLYYKEKSLKAQKKALETIKDKESTIDTQEENKHNKQNGKGSKEVQNDKESEQEGEIS